MSKSYFQAIKEKLDKMTDGEFMLLMIQSGLQALCWEYKGYEAHIEYSQNDNCFYGKIHAISDLITFEADTLDALEQEFYVAVDDYLVFCEDVGKSPDTPKA